MTENATPLPETWAIELTWFEDNNRSFPEKVRSMVCRKCLAKLNNRKKKMTLTDILNAIRTCCSKDPHYITLQTPLMESVFRLLLASPNQMLETTEIANQLSQRRGGVPITAARLDRILGGDRWYGLVKLAPSQ